MLSEDEKQRVKREILAKLQNNYEETVRECERIRLSKIEELEKVAASLKQAGIPNPNQTIEEALNHEYECSG
ncbi:hypothetical protein ACU8KH_02516 [Lachancea thermotolerans]